jgi:hypothetical protein
VDRHESFPVAAPKRAARFTVPKRALTVLVPLGAILIALSHHANVARVQTELRGLGIDLLGLHQVRAAEATREALAYARTSDPLHLQGLEQAARWATSALQTTREGWGEAEPAVQARLARVEQLWSRHYLEAQALVSGVAAGGETDQAMVAFDRSAAALESAVLAASRPDAAELPYWLPGLLCAVAFLLVTASWADPGTVAEPESAPARTDRGYGRRVPQTH